jgi:RHS repeat-associated protein
VTMGLSFRAGVCASVGMGMWIAAGTAWAAEPAAAVPLPAIAEGIVSVPGEVIESPPPPPTETVEYYVTDLIGSTRVVFASDGTVLGSGDYLPYGEELGSATVAAEQFTGQPRDVETAMDYFHARNYQPRVGRFSTSDPAFAGALVNPQAWNRYAYALNNPLSNIDPSGLWAEPCPGYDVCVHPDYDWMNPSMPGEAFPGWAMFLNPGTWCGARVCPEQREKGDSGTMPGKTEPPADSGSDTTETDPGTTNNPGNPGNPGNPPNTGTTELDITTTVVKAKVASLIHPSSSCMDNYMRSNYGDFLGGSVIPDFSLLAIASNFSGYMKSSALSIGIKTALIGIPKAIGSYATTVGTNMAAYPGLAAQSAMQIERGLFWANSAASAEVVVAPAAVLATSFSTTADVMGRFNCM